jgi:L-ascorbate metabolism protein UlaG (beta-lactamase superfamily)
MNVALMKEASFLEKLKTNWMRWKQCQKHYHIVVDWWERVAKKQLRIMFVREGAERRQD